MVSTKQQVLDIAMNLTRVGNWAADGFDAKQKRITLFMKQTNEYVSVLETMDISPRFKPTFLAFKPVFTALHEETKKPKDIQVWAERLMTWGTILTHRAKLLHK